MSPPLLYVIYPDSTPRAASLWERFAAQWPAELGPITYRRDAAEDWREIDSELSVVGVGSELTNGRARVALRAAAPDCVGPFAQPTPHLVTLQRVSPQTFLEVQIEEGEVLEARAFARAVARAAADHVDGMVFDPHTGKLRDPGTPDSVEFATQSPYELETVEQSIDEEDDEVDVDWSSLPHDSLRAFTLVWRADSWPQVSGVDEVFRAIDPLMMRENADEAGGDLWSFAHYADSLGRVVEVRRTNPGARGPAYVRVMFDVDEELAPRSGQLLVELVQLARRFEPEVRRRYGWFPIAYEK